MSKILVARTPRTDRRKAKEGADDCEAIVSVNLKLTDYIKGLEKESLESRHQIHDASYLWIFSSPVIIVIFSESAVAMMMPSNGSRCNSGSELKISMCC